MFQIPTWLLNSTSAAQFAKNPGAPGWSDVAAGIGHSMMDHYRGTLAKSDHGVPPAANAGAGAGLLSMMPKAQAPAGISPQPLPAIAPLAAPHPIVAVPSPVPFQPNFKGLDINTIAKALGGL